MIASLKSYLHRLAAAFCLLSAASTTQLFAEQPTKLGLAIANQNYKGDIPKLTNPVNDIKLIADALVKNGFHVDQVVDADRPKMLREIRDFASKLYIAPEGSVGFLYYSGHGFANANRGENYLLTTNVDKIDKNAWDYAVSLSEIQNILKAYAPWSRVFIVVDACRDELDTPSKSLSNTKGFTAVREAGGMFLAFSTDWGHTATDWPDHESGPYARALSDYLVYPGINHRDLFQRVKDRVDELTLHQQQPIEVNGMKGDYFFAGEPSPKEQEKQASPPQFSVEAIWDLIKDQSDPKILDRFAANYADTPFSKEAKERAERLRALTVVDEGKPKTAPSAKRPLIDENKAPAVNATKPAAGSESNQPEVESARPNLNTGNPTIEKQEPTPNNTPDLAAPKLDVSSKWPSYQRGDTVVLYVKTTKSAQSKIKVQFSFGPNLQEQQQTGVYDARAKLFVVEYRLRADIAPGSYKAIVSLEDASGVRSRKTEIDIEVGLSREEWTASYMQPAPGKAAALVPAKTHSVVVASPDIDRSIETLRALCNKFKDINFALYWSVKGDDSNGRYQIEIAYNLSFEAANTLKKFALDRRISKDPYVLKYGWTSHVEGYHDCIAESQGRQPKSLHVAFPNRSPRYYSPSDEPSSPSGSWYDNHSAPTNSSSGSWYGNRPATNNSPNGSSYDDRPAPTNSPSGSWYDDRSAPTNSSSGSWYDNRPAPSNSPNVPSYNRSAPAYVPYYR